MPLSTLPGQMHGSCYFKLLLGMKGFCAILSGIILLMILIAQNRGASLPENVPAVL